MRFLIYAISEAPELRGGGRRLAAFPVRSRRETKKLCRLAVGQITAPTCLLNTVITRAL
jgi:hypothetical protein